MNLKYFAGLLFTIPLLPLMYIQGKRIKASVPKLDEASNPEGTAISGSNSKHNLRLITIGESTIAGVGADSHKNAISGFFANALSSKISADIEWKVYAKSGYTVQQVTDRLLPKTTNQHAEIILLGIGGNDAFQLSSPSKFRKHVRKFIDEIRKSFPGSFIVIANMPPIKSFPAFTKLIKWTIGNLIEIFGSTLSDELKGEKNLYYNSEIISLKNWAHKVDKTEEMDVFFSDGVHPSKLTYEIWAKDIADNLSKNESFQEFIKIKMAPA